MIDAQSMVGKHRSLDQISQQKAGKSSSLEGAVAITKNVVVLKTDPSGRGSFRSTFFAKREC